VNNPKLVSLSIEASGSCKDEKGMIWVNKLDLFVDGKNIYDYLPADYSEDFVLKKEDVVPLNEENSKSLPFMDKRILAIGESIHGTESMNNMAIDIIKNRIEYKNCKLVLIEIPLEYSLYINRYIHGDQDFKLDSIASYSDKTLLSHSFISLIEWIKNYNLHSEQKVNFLGIDSNVISMKAQVDLFDFFFTLNMGRNNEELAKICTLLLGYKTPLEDIISLFNKNNGFEDILDKNESELARYCLTKAYQNTSSYQNFIYRDCTMYENTELIMKSLLKANETVTIFSHWGHSNYLYGQEASDIEGYAFGYYMRNKYKDDYSCISLMAGSGRFVTSNSTFSNFRIASVPAPPTNSLEYHLNQLGFDSCFFSVDKLRCEDVLKFRMIGSADRNGQFRFIAPKVRMDGVIFFKQVSEIHKNEEVLKQNLYYRYIAIESYRIALIKNKTVKPFSQNAKVDIKSPLRTDARQQVDKMVVNGVVVNEKGELIIGATVLVKGTTYGVIANGNGAFSIQIPPNGAELQVFFIGYVPQTVTVRDQSDIRVVMKEDLTNWDEVVR
jgi:erythromycin esterase-like protein